MATKKTNDMHIIAGLDIGNGYVKGKVSIDGGIPHRVDLPSCVDYVSVGYKWTPAAPTALEMRDLVNELDCDIVSGAIPDADKRRLLVGDRAAAISKSLRQFDIEDHTPKCDNPLSVQLILASVAAEAVGAYWETNNALPEQSLQVTVDLGVALPFSDFIAYRERYKAMLEGNKHAVHIHNFDADITVNISFSTVSVLAEGQAAQYAITELGAEFLDSALGISRNSGLVADKSITGETLVGYTNTVGIDIGEGTVNFPVFRAGVIEPAASSSINRGYGTVLERVMDATRNENYEIDSRKELEKLLRNENPTPMQKAVQDRLRLLEEDEIDTFARDVISEYKRVLAPIKLDCEAVYVFGGGATRVKDALYERLLDASEIAEGVYLPVIYLDSEYSRDLNRNGLFQVAEMASKMT